MQNQSSQNQLVDEIQHEIQRKDTLASQSNKEVPFMTALTSPKLLLCFISLMLGLGSTLANLNNINFILKSLSYKVHYSGMNKGVISIYKVKELFFYVILYFAFNAIIRISSGPFLDVLIKRKKFTLYFIIFTIIGGVSQLTGAIMNKHLLYLSIALGLEIVGLTVCLFNVDKLAIRSTKFQISLFDVFVYVIFAKTLFQKLLRDLE